MAEEMEEKEGVAVGSAGHQSRKQNWEERLRGSQRGWVVFARREERALGRGKGSSWVWDSTLLARRAWQSYTIGGKH
jgi:hypothetical protein